MKKPKINLNELLLALSGSDETESFLDRTTGEILMRWEEDPEVDKIEARLAAGPEGRYEPIERVPSTSGSR
jgi:ABC-type sulfate transport system substrate-binding protein